MADQAEASRQAMLNVLSVREDLHDFGFVVLDSRTKTHAQIKTEVAKGRAYMLEDRSLEQFELIRAWLRQFPKTDLPNRRGTSYGLKHVAAHQVGYCTNGVFIAAAIAEGFEVQRAGPNDPNALLNISSKAWGTYG